MKHNWVKSLIIELIKSKSWLSKYPWLTVHVNISGGSWSTNAKSLAWKSYFISTFGLTFLKFVFALFSVKIFVVLVSTSVYKFQGQFLWQVGGKYSRKQGIIKMIDFIYP